MKLNKRTLLVCVLCALALAVRSELRADDTYTIPAAPVKAALAPPDYKGPVEYEAKVVVVNRAEHTVTVDINGKLHLFKVNAQTQLVRRGKPISLLDVAAGQKVSVVALKDDEGRLQIASLGIDTNWSEAQPAGPGQRVSKSRGTTASGNPSTAKVPPPFQGGSQPNYVERVVVSPEK